MDENKWNNRIGITLAIALGIASLTAWIRNPPKCYEVQTIKIANMVVAGCN